MQDDDVERMVARLRNWSNDPGDMLTLGDEPPVKLMQEAATLIERIASRLSADHTGVLVEALKPFALAADDLDDKHGDNSELWEAPAAMSITAGDLRRARSILAARGEQSPVDGPRE